MEIKNKDIAIKYEKQSLRHIKVENGKIPKVQIVCNSFEFQHLAKALGYGIEEEGLPYHITMRLGESTHMDAYELSQCPGLGAALGVEGNNIAVYTRQLKEKRPIFEYKVTDPEVAKTIGKNAARIVKNKPFLDLDNTDNIIW